MNCNNRSSSSVLNDDTNNVLELWTKLRVHQQAQLDQNQNYTHLHLVSLLEKIQLNWRSAAQENARFVELIERLKRENKNYELELNESNKENKQLKSELASVEKNREELQKELDCYRERFNAARAEIQNASCVITPIFEETGFKDVHFDDQRRDSRNGKRRSRSAVVLAEKKKAKVSDEESHSASIDSNSNECPPSFTPAGNRKMCTIHTSSVVASTPLSRQNRVVVPMRNRMAGQKRRSISEQRGKNTKFYVTQKAAQSSPRPLGTVVEGFGCGWARGRRLERCYHNLVRVTKAFTTCSSCTRMIFGRSLECADCKVQVHEHCQHQLPSLCVPIIPVPPLKRGNSRQRPQLADLCPESRPQIPGQLIHCIFALERGFIKNVGIYRVPGCDGEVKKLKEMFSSKYLPKLDQLDSETITGYIKKFLLDLREPLIPFSSFKEFHNAVTRQNEAQLKTAIEELPIPNRDTLAFLCAHWQKVAMRSNENQMPLENLARVLGPTVVGTASKLTHLAGTVSGDSQHSYHYMEVSKQIDILAALLKLEHRYWTHFYNNLANSSDSQDIEFENSQQESTLTRGLELTANQSLLGPVIAQSRKKE